MLPAHTQQSSFPISTLGLPSCFSLPLSGSTSKPLLEVWTLPRLLQGTAPSKCPYSYCLCFTLRYGSPLHGHCHLVPAVKSFVGTLIWGLTLTELHPLLLEASLLHSHDLVACLNSLLPLLQMRRVVAEPTALYSFSHWTLLLTCWWKSSQAAPPSWAQRETQLMET